jgi:HlyD family secretion protein
MQKIILILGLLILVSCKKKVETTHAITSSITEAVYASGVIKSKNQYQAYATVNGLVQEVFVAEGDVVKNGTPIMSLSNSAQQLSKDNALLAARYADLEANQGKINEAKMMMAFALSKMKNDSSLYFRQKALWEQQVGSRVELEQRELAYQNAKTAYYSAQVRLDDLKRLLDVQAAQAKNNFQISAKQENDFIIKSEMEGMVYTLYKNKGELVSPQTPLAVIGDAQNFIIELQVDEYDILKVQRGQKVMVTMDAYKSKSFEARVDKIYPMMNERSKTFLVEAIFVNAPQPLYPNINLEANIIINEKKDALLVPRNYVINDSVVLSEKGDSLRIKTGLKDYRYVEIISGVSEQELLLKPAE